MIRSRSHFWNFTGWTRLEFAVFENRKVNSADSQACEVNGDTAIDGRRIDSVGQMPGLLTLHEVDLFNRIKVTAVRVTAKRRAPPVFAPQIRMAHVVVVGNRDRGSVAQDVAELQSEFNPAGRMFGVSISLISREEQQIGILRFEILQDLGALAGSATRVAGHIGDHNNAFVDRIASNDSNEFCLVAVSHSIGYIDGSVPVFNTEMRTPSRI